MPQEVDIGDSESERLPLPEAETGSNYRDRPIPPRMRRDDRFDLAGCPRHDQPLSVAGAFTDLDAQGFDGISPSSTAADRIADTLASITRT